MGHSDTLHPAEGEVYHRPSSEIAEHSEMQIHGSIISSLDGLQGGMPQPPTNASVEESGRSSSDSTLAGHARLDAGENIADMGKRLFSFFQLPFILSNGRQDILFLLQKELYVRNKLWRLTQ